MNDIKTQLRKLAIDLLDNEEGITVQSFDIDVFTLILGGEVEVRFSDGRERKISIPPNTPLNARFQLKLGNNVVIILTPNVVVSTLSEEKLKKLREIFTERFP